MKIRTETWGLGTFLQLPSSYFPTATLSTFFSFSTAFITDSNQGISVIPLYIGLEKQLACLGTRKEENESCLHAITFDKENHTLLLLLEDEKKCIPVF